MLDVKDLRVGNFVLSPDTGKPVRVEIGHLIAIQEATTFNGKPYEPLPLTEEWLKKFGYEREGQAPGRIKLDCEFGIVEIWVNGANPLCKYVHQFQNLYYALTGEELKINSEKTANIE